MALASIDRIRIKIQRAKEHIHNLEPELKAFFDTNPYVIGTKRDPHTKQLTYYLVSAKDVPERIAAISGEVLQNLRSALDHLAYALFMIGPGGTSGSPGKHVYFPISDDAAKYMVESPGKVKGMRQDAIDAINATKPYKGGNDTLWILHKLNNIDKHRFVIVVGGAFGGLDLGGHVSGMMRKAFPEIFKGPTLHAFFSTPGRMFPLKVGDEFLIDAADAEVNQEMHFPFSVSFGEAGITEGEPLIETLQGMADLVDNIVSGFAPLL